MKKLLAIVLTLALVLSLSPAVFADGSPLAEVTVSSLDAESDAVKNATVSSEDGTAKIIANKDLTEDEKKEMNVSLEKAKEKIKEDKENVLPYDSCRYDGGKGTVNMEVASNAVIYLVYPNGEVVKLRAKDLTKNADGTLQIPVTGKCDIFLAK